MAIVWGNNIPECNNIVRISGAPKAQKDFSIWLSLSSGWLFFVSEHHMSPFFVVATPVKSTLLSWTVEKCAPE